MSSMKDLKSTVIQNKSTSSDVEHKALDSSSYLVNDGYMDVINIQKIDTSIITKTTQYQNHGECVFNGLINQSVYPSLNFTVNQKKNMTKPNILSRVRRVRCTLKVFLLRLRVKLARLFLKSLKNVIPKFLFKYIINFRKSFTKISEGRKSIHPTVMNNLCATGSDWYNITFPDGTKECWFIEIKAYLSKQTECNIALAMEKIGLEFSEAHSLADIPHAIGHRYSVDKYKDWHLVVRMVQCQMLERLNSKGVDGEVCSRH